MFMCLGLFGSACEQFNRHALQREVVLDIAGFGFVCCFFVFTQSFFLFRDAFLDLPAVGAVFVHFHFRKHGLRVIRQMAGGFTHFVLGWFLR